MKIGFIGLGKMGMQMTQRLVKGGHTVIAMDLNPAAVESAVQLGAQGASSKQELINKLSDGHTIVIWLMIPSNLVQAEIESWVKLLPAGSVIVDGGNSDYRDTLKRAELVAGTGSYLVDVGTSGGVLGLENGFSMMIGGDSRGVATIEPAIASLAQPEGWGHFGEAGTGHYIKMIHNAIEYGMMEAYAEGFHLLKKGPVKQLKLGAIADVWQHGSIISSSLNEMAAHILHTNPDLSDIDGYVAETGEARWTIEVANDKHIALPVVEAALQVRTASQAGHVHFGTKILAALRNAFGGHAVNKS